MSLAPVTIKCHADSTGLGCHLGWYWCPGVMLPLGPCRSGWPLLTPGAMVTARPGLLPRTMSGSMDLWQSRSVLKSVAHVAIKGHMEPGVWTTTYGLVGDGGEGCVLLLEPS